MGDLLIRDVPSEIKLQLGESARRSGRSLSEEAKYLLRRSFELEGAEQPSAADIYGQFRERFSDELLSDEEHSELMSAINSWKKESIEDERQAAE